MQIIKNTTDFFQVLNLRNLSKIKRIWKRSHTNLKDEKTFLQILVIMIILTKRFSSKKFKLVFDYFAPQFGIKKLFMNTCGEHDDEDDEIYYDWSLSGNDDQNPIYVHGCGYIDEKVLRVGFECYDGFEDVSNYQYPPE